MWGYILTAFVFFVGGAWAMFRFLEISAKRNERKEKEGSRRFVYKDGEVSVFTEHLKNYLKQN